MRRKIPLAALAAALALSGCVTVDGSQPAPGASVTSPDPGPTSVPGAETGARPVRLVGCDPVDPDVEIVCEAHALVRRHYVDRVSDSALAAAAERGLEDLDGTTATGELICASPAEEFQEVCDVAAKEADTSVEAAEAMVGGMATFGLDANSVYLDPEALQMVEEEQHGEIEGIGALVSAEDASSGEPELCAVVSDTCRLYIVSTIAGTPADEAGLERDDVIVAVDGEDVRGRTVEEVTARVRGPAGTEVTITVERDGERIEVEMVRAAVVIPVVVSRKVDDAGYVALNVFSDNADEEFETALIDLLDDGVSTLVIDLRDNPGGLLDTAVEVASAFLPDGDVVVTESPESSTSYSVSGNLIVPADIAVVFVVNRASASASEVVSAVLQERGRATVVGENTFGKNTVQQRFSLSNGGALKLTIARWVTPGGLDFGEVGVTPDVIKEIEAGLTPEKVVQEAVSASLTLGK